MYVCIYIYIYIYICIYAPNSLRLEQFSQLKVEGRLERGDGGQVVGPLSRRLELNHEARDGGPTSCAKRGRTAQLCSADGSTHTESNKLYRKVKHRYRPNLSILQRPKRAPIRRR